MQAKRAVQQSNGGGTKSLCTLNIAPGMAGPHRQAKLLQAGQSIGLTFNHQQMLIE